MPFPLPCHERPLQLKAEHNQSVVRRKLTRQMPVVALPPSGGGGMKVERKHLTATMQRVPHWSGVVMFIPLPMSCDAKNPVSVTEQPGG